MVFFNRKSIFVVNKMKIEKYWCLFSDGSCVNQVLCAFLVNLSVVAYGMVIGCMSPMTLLLQSENTPIGKTLSDTEVSVMASIAYILCIPCTFVMAYIGDNCGRKPALLIMSLSFIVHWSLLLSSWSSWSFILARAVTGLGMASAFVVCPMYIKEISQDSIRGALGSLIIVSQTSGNLISYVIGYLMSYELVLWASLAVPVFHIVVFVMMPESPSYLLKKGREMDAISAMAWLRCRQVEDESVLAEVECLKKEQLRDEGSSKFAIKAIWQDSILLKTFWIAMAVTLAREVCGANPVLNFAASIFDLSGASGSFGANEQAMVLGAVQVLGSTLASSLVENTGRKPLLIVTSLVSGLSMCALATWFLLDSMEVYAPGWVPLATLCLCIFCDAAGLQPISIVVLNEIFSFKYRSTVSAVTMSTASLADFLQLLFFKPLAKLMGVYIPFYFFGAVCLANAIYVTFKLPETKRKSVEEIYEEIGRK